MCFPVVHGGTRLGYLWLIEGDQPLGEEEVRAASAAADAAAVVLFRERMLGELALGRERELLRDLLSTDAAARSGAAAALVDADIVAAGRPTVLVLRPLGGPPVADEGRRLAIDTALTAARRHAPPRRVLHLARPDLGMLLVTDERQRTDADIAELAACALDEYRKAAGDDRAVVGIGEPQPGLAEAGTSYRQAGQAARVGEVVPSMGPVVRWSNIGVYRTLLLLPPEQLRAEAIPAGLVEILDGDQSDPLVATVECYLDFAGDVKLAAAALAIHRTTLYYRLGKIEKAVGLDLRSGTDRLALHLGIKIARLAGLLEAPEPRARLALSGVADPDEAEV